MMKRRVTERVLVLIISIAVLLSSTGVYSVFAETYSEAVSSSSSTTVSSSSSTAAANETTTAKETTTPAENKAEVKAEPNIVSDGGSVEIDAISGSGTTEDPYRIEDADDLFRMQDIINDSSSADKYFVLTNDIDLSGVSYAQLKENPVLPGTIVSVDKSKSDAAPDKVQFTLNGANHKIFGLNVTNTGSAGAAIFGYISAKSTVKYVKFENITVNASYEDAVATAAIALYNNGQLRNCKVNGAYVKVGSSVSGNVETKTVNKSLTLTESAGLVAINTGRISDIGISKSSVSVYAEKKNIGAVAGINSGSISSVKLSGATVKVAYGDATGAVAGRNSGKIEAVTVTSISAEVGAKAAFGGIAGINSGAIVSCVASGKATGSSYAGGIVGKAVSADGSTKTSNVKGCYTFVKLAANSETGAVIASGESRYSDNVWSSETSGRVRACEDGNTDGDLVRSARLAVVKEGTTKSISKASLGGQFAGAGYVLDTTKNIAFSGTGISFSETEDSILVSADSADRTGKITYTARIAVQAGYENASVVTQKFTVAVLTVPEDTKGDGLTEETALEIGNAAELRMISAAPFAHFILTDDIRMSENWDSSFSLTGSLNGNGHKITAVSEFCYAVYGKITNVKFVLADQINKAVFGKADNAVFDGVRLTKGKSAEENIFVGVVAKKSGTGAFLNKVSGRTVLNNCFTNVPVYVNDKDIKKVAGFIAVLDSDEAVITSCGAVASISGKYDEKVECGAAFIGSASENANGTINNCYATVYSDITKYALIGGGDKNVAVENSYFGSSNEKAAAAPSKFENVNAEKWMFDEGSHGFVTGKGCSVSITLPSNIINASNADAKSFKLIYDAEELKADANGITVENGVVTVPVETAKAGATVIDSSFVIVHKETGLRAEIAISNGLEKDSEGNYLLNSGADFIYINDNFDKFCDERFIMAKDLDMSDVELTAVGGAAGAFTGSVDGKGHTISGLKIESEAKAALFGALDGASVKNIVFENAEIICNGSFAAVLAAQVTGGTRISNVEFKNCRVEAKENCAGILAGEIKDSRISDIKVSECETAGLNNVGILAGAAENAEIKGVKATEIKATGEDNVGLIGSAKGTALGSVSVADAQMNSKKNAGALAGSAEKVNAEKIAVSNAEINAQADALGASPAAGGIFGSFSGKLTEAEITKSAVKAEGSAAAAGAIAGLAENAELNAVICGKGVKVEGAVAGGIIGEAEDKISVKDSKTFANVYGDENATKVIEGAGGIIGRVSADDFGTVTIENTNAAGSVKAAGYVGGIIGSVLSQKTDGVSVKNCVSGAVLDVTDADGKETSGHVIGYVAELSDKDINAAVSSVIYSSYASELNAYGNVDAPDTYCDLDSDVEASLKDVITDSKEVTVKVSNSKASKLGFIFDEKEGWKSESEKRIEVLDSTENQVKLAAYKTGKIGIVGTYKLASDESIELRVHFLAESDIDIVLDGEGTKDAPYIISNASELEAAASYADRNAYFTLTDDIKFNAEDFEFGGEFYNEGKGFTSIGTAEAPFNGVFNGNGHTISGLVINGVENGALFGTVSGAEISGVTLKNASVAAEKLAAGIAAKAIDSSISDVEIIDSAITAASAEGSAAAVAAYADNCEISNVSVEAVEITASVTETSYNVACAGAVCARAIDTVISSASVDSETVVSSDGAAAGFAAYCNNVTVKDSETFAEISGCSAAAVTADVKGKLAAKNITAGGTVDGTEFAGGIAAKAYAAVEAEDIIVSAKISGEGKTAIVAAYAEESVFTDSAKSAVKLSDILYSSYQNTAKAFADDKINAYQNAEYADAVVDINTITAKDGGFVAVGKEDVKVSDEIKSEYDISGFECADVYSNPENLVKYNKADGTVTATGTAIEDAKLVIGFTNGLEAAVDLVAVEGMTGEGTNAEPYIIDSEDTLKLLKVYPDAVFLMKNDVVLTEDWAPVENFSGSLDGAGCSITGLTVKAENAGLFETLSGSASVKNITFADASVEGKSSAGVVAAGVADNAQITGVNVISSTVKADDYAAAVAGTVQAASAKIENCRVTGCTVSAKNAAGIAALVSGKSVISSGSVDATEIKGKDAAGGIVAFSQADSLDITECEAAADVSAENAGAIAGVIEKSVNITSSTTNGTVSGRYSEGGIIGYADGNVSVKNSKAFAALSGDATHTAAIVAKFATLPEDNEKFAENFSGNVISGENKEFEPAVMQYQNFVPAQTKENEITLEGSGTKENPYKIASAADLLQIPDSSTAYFVLESDIKLTAKDYSISVNKDGETVYGVFSDGYRPIKNFAGVFDGNGHVIKGLCINSDSDYVGMFANITADGTVKNLHIELLEESAGLGYFGISGNDYVGGIAGYCDSVNGIENCSVTGSVISGRHAVGGLVGGLAASKISDSFAMTEINAQNKAGGIAGITSGKASIENSFVSCEVNAAGGALIGDNNGALTLTDVMINGISHGTGAFAIGQNNGTVKAVRVLIAGENSDEKAAILNADEAENVYADKTTLGAADENIKGLTTAQLTSSKPEGLEGWNQSEGRYPVPAMADKYSDKMAAEAAVPGGKPVSEDSVGNLEISYSLVNKTGEKAMNSKLAGILIKSKNNGKTITSDFFTTCGGEKAALNKLLVTTGGFYVDSSLPDGYEFVVAAKDSKGRDINVSDAGSLGSYVECGAADEVELVISIVRTDTPWGVSSLWESLSR